MENKPKKYFAHSSFKMVIAVVLLAAIFVSITIVYFKTYYSTKNKYEDEIGKLNEEILNLRDQANHLVEVDKTISLSVIESKLQAINELATMEYIYTDAGRFEETEKTFIFKSTKSFVAKWDGVIKAGIDIKDVKLSINEENKEISVSMPKANILSHEIKAETAKVLNEENGVFNKIEVKDVNQLYAKSKMHMEARAIENGILEKAHDNAKITIENLILTIPDVAANYTVAFIEVE